MVPEVLRSLKTYWGSVLPILCDEVIAASSCGSVYLMRVVESVAGSTGWVCFVALLLLERSKALVQVRDSGQCCHMVGTQGFLVIASYWSQCSYLILFS